MSACWTCGGFGDRHDPIAHDGYFPRSHWSVAGRDENGDLDGEVCHCWASTNHPATEEAP